MRLKRETRLPSRSVNRYRLSIAFSVFSKNGEILPESAATVPLADISYAYGFGVYETIRAVRGHALFLADHVERLLFSASVIGLEHTLSTGLVGAWTMELLKKIEAEACNLKMLLIGGKDATSATLYIIPLAPLFPDKRLYTRGAHAITVEYERYLPHAKTLNMLPSYLAYRKARQADCYDALLINRRGCITEGTRTNFFAMKGRTIISPPQSEVLEGVTMKHVLATGIENGYEIQYRDIPLAEIGEFDGVMLTSTSSKIMPLSRINQTELTIGSELRTLMEHFDRFLGSVRE